MATQNSINNNSGTLTVASGLTVTSGGVTVTAGGLTVTAGATSIGVTGNNSFTVASGTSQISIGNDAVAHTVLIGTTTGGATTSINAGTGGYNLYVGSGSASQTVTSSGYVTFPLTPAFMYYLGSSDNSVTGNGATYTFGTTGNALTKVFDQGSNCTTAGVFTAPVTGKYELGVFLRINSLTAAMTSGVLTIVTTGVSYALSTDSGGIRTGGNIESQAFSSIVPMTAADTCTITLVISSGASNAAGVSGGQGLSYFYGTLVC
jgi:hypothetical protein